MKQFKLLFFILLTGMSLYSHAQKSNDYIEFNDRKNTVHGVYLGISAYYGQINNKDTYIGSLKIAYVSNQEFEIGLVGTAFYSEQNINGTDFTNADLVGAYGGFHIEPILFSKHKVNLSFPILFGGGAVGVVEGDITNSNTKVPEWDAVFAVEPGVSILYNISRYVQIEMGAKYRFLSKLDLDTTSITDANGFSAGVGIKIGVFNMGRNRYKKNR
tara:strand:- start:105923 stop:106567 length:645 start_codon:yes stop_codon:yes gene_type:complete